MESGVPNEHVFISLLEFGFSEVQARDAATRFDNLEAASNYIVSLEDASSTSGVVGDNDSEDEDEDEDEYADDDDDDVGGGGRARAKSTKTGGRVAGSEGTGGLGLDDLDFSILSEELKMVLCVRTDLKMTPGKIAAQCVHAALGACRDAMADKKLSNVLSHWSMTGEKTVALKVESEAAMLGLEASAVRAGLIAYIVCDAGRTQIDPGSRTVLAIGPAKRSQIDAITGTLKLL